MILAAPILAKRHIGDKLRLNVVVVVVHELPISLVVEVEIFLHFAVKSELILQQLVDQILVVHNHRFGDSLRVIFACADKNKAAISIICYEIEEKVENTSKGQKYIFHVNIGEIKKLLDLQCLKEYIKNNNNLPDDLFRNSNLSNKIKAFLICEGKETNSEGICKIDYEDELQKMSLEAFWG